VSECECESKKDYSKYVRANTECTTALPLFLHQTRSLQQSGGVALPI
jgi:hypothetical protein